MELINVEPKKVETVNFINQIKISRIFIEYEMNSIFIDIECYDNNNYVCNMSKSYTLTEFCNIEALKTKALLDCDLHCCGAEEHKE